jgi:hypothetical protein
VGVPERPGKASPVFLVVLANRLRIACMRLSISFAIVISLC